jgi:hypothetical protein
LQQFQVLSYEQKKKEKRGNRALDEIIMSVAAHRICLHGRANIIQLKNDILAKSNLAFFLKKSYIVVGL